MKELDEHAIRLSQAGEPYEEAPSVPLWKGLVPAILTVWALLGAAGYCLYRAYEAWPA